MLTPRDLQVLISLANYFLLNRRQVQELCYSGDKTGRIARRRLLTLQREGYINKHTMLVVNPADGTPAPVYFLARQGRETLAEELHDDRYLLRPIELPQPTHVHHYLAVSETHITLDKAIEQQKTVTLDAWHNEAEIVNVDEVDKKDHFRLYTLLRKEPRLICAPDAAFQLSLKEDRAAFYLEQDRGTGGRGTGARQLAARKTPGYIELHRRNMHRGKHFPNATVERLIVLSISPTPNRRDALLRAFSKKEGSHFWRFASQTELTPETFLFEPVWHRCDADEPGPLVKQ